MPIEYAYDEKANVLYTRFFGVVTDDDLRNQARAVAEDGRVRPEVRELVDLSEIEKVEASPDTFDDIIVVERAHGQKFLGMRTAIFAPTDLLYGYSRMFQSMADLREAPSTVKTFRTLQEARDWLGL